MLLSSRSDHIAPPPNNRLYLDSRATVIIRIYFIRYKYGTTTCVCVFFYFFCFVLFCCCCCFFFCFPSRYTCLPILPSHHILAHICNLNMYTYESFVFKYCSANDWLFLSFYTLKGMHAIFFRREIVLRMFLVTLYSLMSPNHINRIVSI